MVLESILSPWVTTIQRWWRAHGRERVPPFYAANVVQRWMFHDDDEDEPLYNRWFQMDLNEGGYALQPMVPGGPQRVGLRSTADGSRWTLTAAHPHPGGPQTLDEEEPHPLFSGDNLQLRLRAV